jgi:hypothetical protein
LDKDTKELALALGKLSPESRDIMSSQIRLCVAVETAIRRQYGLSAEGYPGQAVQAGAEQQRAGV